MSGKHDRETKPFIREGMRRRTLLLSTTSLVAASGLAARSRTAIAQQAQETILPKPKPPFNGKIGRTVKDSTPDFPKGVEAPAGAPNVLLILTDDVGFGATSTFGGPIQTPTFQRLADSGLRYNMYHTTALCSPTRAALITGPDYRTKPPFGRQRRHHRACHRLPGLQLAGAQERRLRRGRPQGQWL
jgi:arylsulfatase